MSENPPGPPEAENVRAIRQLVRLMKRYDLSAIDFVEGSTQIRLRRRGHEVAHAAPAAPAAPAPAAAPPPPTAPAATPAPAAPAGVTIESPMVGTVYLASGPDVPPYVSVGSRVRGDTVVCMFEAMKVFTEVPAGVEGTITEVLVKNGQPVEYGQALFRVDPA